MTIYHPLNFASITGIVFLLHFATGMNVPCSRATHHPYLKRHTSPPLLTAKTRLFGRAPASSGYSLLWSLRRLLLRRHPRCRAAATCCLPPSPSSSWPLCRALLAVLLISPSWPPVDGAALFPRSVGCASESSCGPCCCFASSGGPSNPPVGRLLVFRQPLSGAPALLVAVLCEAAGPRLAVSPLLNRVDRRQRGGPTCMRGLPLPNRVQHRQETKKHQRFFFSRRLVVVARCFRVRM